MLVTGGAGGLLEGAGSCFKRFAGEGRGNGWVGFWVLVLGQWLGLGGWLGLVLLLWILGGTRWGGVRSRQGVMLDAWRQRAGWGG